MIVAADENNLIGQNNALPWSLPMDMRYFKNQTWGMPVLMGRNTFESLGGSLSGRQNMVLTTNTEWQHDKVKTIHSIREGIAYAEGLHNKELFIIGGSAVYKQAINLADRIYITRVHHVFENGDAWFPEIRNGGWKLVSERKTTPNEKNAYAMSFQIWEKAEG